MKLFAGLGGIAARLKFFRIIWKGIRRIRLYSGVFTGLEEKSLAGVKDIFGGIFKGLEAIVKVPLNAIITLVNKAISGINTMIKALP